MIANSTGSDSVNEKVTEKGCKRSIIFKKNMKTCVCFLLVMLLVSGCVNQGSSPQDEPASPEPAPESTPPPVQQTIPESGEIPMPADDLTITVIFDNNLYDPELTESWGFSCLIEGCEKTILFDTGGDGNILSGNMGKLGVNPEDIDVIVLSHIHGDHTDGLPSVLRKNSDVTVYVLQTFPFSFKEDVKGYGAEVVAVENPLRICENVYSTGLLSYPVDEQSLIIRTDRGLIVITGCAHPGIVRIVKKAKELFQEDVLLVMGGFHLTDTSMSKIEGIVSDFRELGVLYAGPCHCSGYTAQELFKEEYGQYYVEIGVGRIIYVKDLE